MTSMDGTVTDGPRRRLLAAGAAALLAAACGGVETHTVNIQTAAGGTQIEAKQVVTLVYAQAPDAEIDTLLYSGGDLSRAIKRLRDSYPRLKSLLDQGVVGNTVGGFVAVRDTARSGELRKFLWDENRDRAFLHDRASAAVGHGGDDLNGWLPYASYSFGKEWIAQGQSGWWWLDDQRQWRQGPPKD